MQHNKSELKWTEFVSSNLITGKEYGQSFTGIGKRMVPRLRDSRVLTSPLAAGARFTQPRDHSLADPCICSKQDRKLKVHVRESYHQRTTFLGAPSRPVRLKGVFK